MVPHPRSNGDTRETRSGLRALSCRGAGGTGIGAGFCLHRNRTAADFAMSYLHHLRQRPRWYGSKVSGHPRDATIVGSPGITSSRHSLERIGAIHTTNHYSEGWRYDEGFWDREDHGRGRAYGNYKDEDDDHHGHGHHND
jgi:hypothetical protein